MSTSVNLSQFSKNLIFTVASRVSRAPESKKNKYQKDVSPNDFKHLTTIMGSGDFDVQNKKQYNFIVDTLLNKIENSEYASSYQKDSFIEDLKKLRNFKKFR